MRRQAAVHHPGFPNFGNPGSQRSLRTSPRPESWEASRSWEGHPPQTLPRVFHSRRPADMQGDVSTRQLCMTCPWRRGGHGSPRCQAIAPRWRAQPSRQAVCHAPMPHDMSAATWQPPPPGPRVGGSQARILGLGSVDSGRAPLTSDPFQGRDGAAHLSAPC